MLLMFLILPYFYNHLRINYDLGKYYTIIPATHNWNLEDFITAFKAKSVPFGFSYSSGENTEWETVESLRNLIKEHVDSDFIE